MTLSALSTLAALYGDGERIGASITLGERVTLALGDVVGAHHPDTVRSASNLIVAYSQARRVDEAVRLGVRLTAELQAALGEDHPDTRRVRDALVHACEGSGRWVASMALRFDDVERLTVKLGIDALGPTAARQQLAAQLAERGLFRAASRQQRLVLEALATIDVAPIVHSEAQEALDRYLVQAQLEPVGTLDVSQLRDLRPLIDVAAAMRALHQREGVLT